MPGPSWGAKPVTPPRYVRAVSAPSTTATDAPAAAGIPRRYWIWLGGVGLSLLGTQVLAFGMTWAAASVSGVLAGLVLTAVNLPRVLLLLVGGAVADRAGPFRVLLIGDGVMLIVTATFAIGLHWLGVSGPLLLAAALAVGVVDAFYIPASGTMPRRLVGGPALPRAMAARQLAGQVAAFAGAPLGGALVALAGLTAAAVFDAWTFALMLVVLVVLVVLRRRMTTPDRPRGPESALWRRSLDGLQVVATDRPLRLSMLLLCAAAGLLLPVGALLVPLLGRDRGWTAGAAGLVVGAIALGAAIIAVGVLARRASARPGVAGPAGLLLAAADVVGVPMVLVGCGVALAVAAAGALASPPLRRAG
jgi:MFS family permease